jgi:hypothetical protein
MAQIPESVWLYTRGSQSVRLVRQESANGCGLFLYGPGTDVVTYEFANVAECMKRQAELEQGLLAAGYRLAQISPDRRSEHRSWHESDRCGTAS